MRTTALAVLAACLGLSACVGRSAALASASASASAPASAAALAAAVAPTPRGQSPCTIARVRSHPAGVGRLDVVASDRAAIVWVMRTSGTESLYACVPGARGRHLIEMATTGNGLTESLSDVRVRGSAIGYLFTTDEQFGSTVSLRVARADGSAEASEVVGEASDDSEPGQGLEPGELGSWTLDAGGDLLWSESLAVNGAQLTELFGLAGTRRGPVDPVTLGVGGPFTRLGLAGGISTWATPAGPGRVDLHGRTTLAQPSRTLGTCDLLTRAEVLTALGARVLPEPTRAAGECDYATRTTALDLTKRYGPFASLTGAERAGEEAGVSAGPGVTKVVGIGDAAYLYTDGLGPVELTVFRGAFEFSVEEFPGASVAGLEALASDVLGNVG